MTLSRTFTFWRFPIQIQLRDVELCIKYSINKSVQLSFFVPAINQNMRWATYSVRGGTSSINDLMSFAFSVTGLVPVLTKKNSRARGTRMVMIQCGSTCFGSTRRHHFTSLLAEEINSIATGKPRLAGINASLRR